MTAGDGGCVTGRGVRSGLGCEEVAGAELAFVISALFGASDDIGEGGRVVIGDGARVNLASSS